MRHGFLLLLATMALASVPTKLRAVLGGSGSAIMKEAAVVDAVLGLVSKKPSETVLAYLGTATYDFETNREAQVAEFRARGVAIEPLDVALTTPSPRAVEAALARADVVLVSGGNTLFAVDRWARCGVTSALRAAAERGVVLCGGSAGAICWFDAGHSDSMDPDWYADLMLAGGGAADPAYAVLPGSKPWQYIRCPCLGLLPGLCCPHHDRTQSNGVLRSTDFDAMLRRHPGELGVCIDHHAALVVDGSGNYEVLTLAGKEGSRVEGGDAPDFSGAGSPAIWLKRVVDDAVAATLLPARGRLADVLEPATTIVEDPRVAAARGENPSDRDRV